MYAQEASMQHHSGVAGSVELTKRTARNWGDPVCEHKEVRHANKPLKGEGSRGRYWKSEVSIVAKKTGNSDGAKGRQ